MKKLLLSFCLIAPMLASAQLVSLEVEAYAVHDGMVGETDLTGFTTYRLWANLTNETDFVSGALGEPDKQIKIETTTSFLQVPAGALTGAEINPIIYDFVPELEYDSWVTIGREDNTTPGDAISTIQSGTDPWITEFNNGGNIIMDGLFGGAWYITLPAANGYAGPDLKVLLGQFTTDGEFGGIITLQIFPMGVGANAQTNIAVPFSGNPDAIFGCTDPEATNFDEGADTNDYSCIYPCNIGIEELNLTYNCPGDDGNNASINIVPSGIQGAAFYSLNGGNTQQNPNYANLLSGVYNLEISDSQGCEFTQQIDLTTSAPIEVNPVATDISCVGEVDGVINVETVGGSGEFSYGFAPDNLEFSDAEITGLAAGDYTLYVEDGSGCTGSADAAVTISEPEALVFNDATAMDATCFNSIDGSITVDAEGGTGELSYSLDNESFLLDNPVPAAPGEYTVYVEDENGCTAQSAGIITVEGGPEITFSADATASSCFDTNDGAIDAAFGGGTGDLTISWTGPDDYSSDMSNISDLVPGMYMATITDENNCVLESDAIEIVAPSEISVTATAASALCAGSDDGSIEVSAEGGNDGAYSYQIDGLGFGADSVFTGVAAGDHTIDVMDELGCEADEVMVTIEEPAAIEVIETDITGTDCNGGDDGEISVSAEGGTGELSYSINGVDFEDAGDFDDLEAGTYTVTISDENACLVTADNLTVEEPDAIELTEVVVEQDGGDGGSIDITVAGGTGAYTYAWTGPNGFTSDEADITGLEVGDYTITITDENDCTLTSDIVSVTVGLNEILANLDIKVMPNPSNGQFSLFIEGYTNEVVNMTVLDVVGKTIISEQINGNGDIRKDIDITGQASGIYFLQLTVGESIRTIKLVKNN